MSSGAPAPAFLIAGTTSDAGKSLITAGLCRLLSRRGLRVAPFKAQNMSLNSAVAAPDVQPGRDGRWSVPGAEVGRAQALQALAAGVPAEAQMNPVLLKPSGEMTSHILLMGRPWSAADAVGYGSLVDELRPHVLAALADLRHRFDVVVAEGAGGIAEPNLRDRDLVNAGLAEHADLPILIVADIERGGAFASLYGSWALLDEADRERVVGFVLNRFRGDPSLLDPAIDELRSRTGVPMLGVLPWIEDLDLPAEDSLGLRDRDGGPAIADPLDVAVIRLPRLSNFTDVDALAVEPGVRITHTDRPSAVASADLVVLPGTRATISDLRWLRERGLADALVARADGGGPILGICGGYQMLGGQIIDGVEHPGPGPVEGLGLLDVSTVFAEDKVVAWTRDVVLGGLATGYEIRHGRTGPDGEGHQVSAVRGPVLGTSLHGLLDDDAARRRILAWAADLRGVTVVPGDVSAAAHVDVQIDRLAEVLAAHLDLDGMLALVAPGHMIRR